EERTLLSALVLGEWNSPSPAGPAAVAGDRPRPRIDVERPNAVRIWSPWIESRNVSYPTSAGPGERLDVYLPESPIPPGGGPVLIAIHGGGWRRFNKSGYGARIASAFVPHGYVVVAPNYDLSAPGRSS